MLRVYLDVCAINRISDDPTQSRIRSEAQAVNYILGLVLDGRVVWSSSLAVEREIMRNMNHEKRNDALVLLSYAREIAAPTREIVQRAHSLKDLGYGAFDGLHLAFAESAGATLLTTDDRFMRQCARGLGNPKVQVLNPVHWLAEVQSWPP